LKLERVCCDDVKIKYWLTNHITYDGETILYIYIDRVGNEITRTPEEYKRNPVTTIYQVQKATSC
jgi:hypothetical protein